MKPIFARTILLVIALAFASLPHSRATTAPPSPEDIVTYTPDEHPEGERWVADSKIQFIEFKDEPFANLLQALSTGYGLRISTPRIVADRLITIQLRDVTYRDIITFVLKDTDYEAIFGDHIIVIKRKTPNQALQHNDHGCHGLCRRTLRASHGRG